MLHLVTAIEMAFCVALLVVLVMLGIRMQKGMRSLQLDVRALERHLRESQAQWSARWEEPRPTSLNPGPGPQCSTNVPQGVQQPPKISLKRGHGRLHETFVAPVRVQFNTGPLPLRRDPVQDLVHLYNSMSSSSESEESWNLEFQSRQGRTLGVSNASERQRDQSLAPVFVENDNGYLDIMPDEEDRYEAYAFPRARLPMDRKRWEVGALAFVFRSEGSEMLDRTDAQIEVIQPARMRREMQSGQYELHSQGVLRFF